MQVFSLQGRGLLLLVSLIRILFFNTILKSALEIYAFPNNIFLMPKSNNSSRSPSSASHPKPSADDAAVRLSDVALRKKKNADAQAAFRARRAHYIATLEETVTSLESVVLQLQDSCKEARAESHQLRQENGRLRLEFRDREKLWRNLWQTKKDSQGVDCEEPPLPPSSILAPASLMGSLQLDQYGNNDFAYRVNEDTHLCNMSYQSGPSQYPTPAPLTSFPSGAESPVPDDVPIGSRGERYGAYPYPLHNVHQEGQWSIPQNTSTDSGGSANINSASSCRSPSFATSPQNSTDTSFSARFTVEDQKPSLNSLDTAPYVFHNNRSLSPALSTPTSSSASLTYSFPVADAGGHDHIDLDYRRHPHSHATEATLHGGTADISLMGPSNEAARSRLGTRPLLPPLPVSGNDTGIQHEQGSSDCDTTTYSHSRPHPRNIIHSSRSPSPSSPAISGTLAVIKAQAFGALRRTRTRAKKSSEGAAKVAMDVLEARGIGLGIPVSNLKRQRVEGDDSSHRSLLVCRHPEQSV